MYQLNKINELFVLNVKMNKLDRNVAREKQPMRKLKVNSISIYHKA